jgi:hypothetical protein
LIGIRYVQLEAHVFVKPTIFCFGFEEKKIEIMRNFYRLHKNELDLDIAPEKFTSW